MSLPLVSIFLVATLLAAWRGRRRLAAAFVGVAVTLLFALGTGPLTNALLADLQRPFADATNPRPWPARAVIVLPGMGLAGSDDAPQPLSYGRIAAAAAAYRACRASGGRCSVIVSGGAVGVTGATEAQVYAGRLVTLGVEARDIALEPEARSTWDNARLVRPLIDRLQPQRVCLVTSGPHLRRTMLYFRHFGIDAIPVAADHAAARPSLLPDAWNFALTDAVLGEYEGLLRYRAYNAFGLNPPSLPLPSPRENAAANAAGSP